MAIKVKGMKQLRSNMNKEFERLSGEVTEKGIYSGLILLSGYSALVVPIGETSNLANSQFIYKPTKVGNTIKGSVAYLADYADYVHDGGEKNWQRSGAIAEYLTTPAEQHKTEIFQAIKEGSKT